MGIKARALYGDTESAALDDINALRDVRRTPPVHRSDFVNNAVDPPFAPHLYRPIRSPRSAKMNPGSHGLNGF